MTVLLKRRNLVRALVCSTLLVVCAKTPGAESPAELGDVAGRIDYGYYAADLRTLEAAYDALRQRSGQRAAESYYVAYAAYRLSQMAGSSTQHRFRDFLTECIRTARDLTADSEWSIEAWILIAACSIEGRNRDQVRALVYERRLTESLRAARAINPAHPRLLLVDAWAQLQPGSMDRSRDGAYQSRLEDVRAAFGTWRGAGIGFDWGRAEVLTELANIQLANEQRRDARDLIEQALIEAPEYHVALALQNTLLLRR